MATTVRALIRGYHYLNIESADPRTQTWFAMSSPWPMFTLIVSYIYFVQTLGPRLMKDKEPFKLERVLQIYNVTQILSSGYLFYKALTLAWLWNYKFFCEPVDYSDDPTSVAIARLVWLYFLMKVVDLLDTIFFVLRKKNDQVSFLHVYHHAGMVFGSWCGVKYLPGGHGTLLGVINSFVHVIMYSHYLATSLKMSRQWWKKYITQLQILQFLINIIHFVSLIIINDCDYPQWPAFVFIPQNIFMIVLFGDFYHKTYVRRRKNE